MEQKQMNTTSGNRRFQFSQKSSPPHTAFRPAHQRLLPKAALIYVGTDALIHLRRDQRYVEHCESNSDVLSLTPMTLALPENIDPACFRWPVNGLRCQVVGQISRCMLILLLRELAAAGAAAVAAVDTEGELHTYRGT